MTGESVDRLTQLNAWLQQQARLQAMRDFRRLWAQHAPTIAAMTNDQRLALIARIRETMLGTTHA